MKKFDDFLLYLDNHKEDYFDMLSNVNMKFKLPINDEESLNLLITELTKYNNQNTINLLKIYHDWNNS